MLRSIAEVLVENYADASAVNNKVSPLKCSGLNGTFFSSKCFVSFSYSPTSWDDANQYCLSWGGQLPSIHSANENLAVRAVAPVTSLFWLGLSRSSISDNLNNSQQLDAAFTWSDGSSRNSYSNWEAGEPNTIDPAARCVHFETALVNAGASTSQWNQLNCQTRAKDNVPFSLVVCQFPLQAQTVYNIDECTDQGGLPINTTSLHSQCVVKHKILSPISSSTASSLCSFYGGSLPILSSSSDNSLVGAYALGMDPSLKYWLGLNDVQTPGVLHWSDGSSLSYTAWAGSSSTLATNTSNCVDSSYNSISASYQWSVYDCNAPFSNTLICAYFLDQCARDPTSTPPSPQFLPGPSGMQSNTLQLSFSDSLQHSVTKFEFLQLQLVFVDHDCVLLCV